MLHVEPLSKSDGKSEYCSLGIWHIITGEYPPQQGGVSDYTNQVANGLASADNSVHVWVPQCNLPDNNAAGVSVHRLPGHFGPRALAQMARAVRAKPCRVLVQYVPHAYGFKAMNLPFCLWLRSIRHVGPTVMFHEVAFPMNPGQLLRHHMLGAVTRLMARLVCHSANRIMVAGARWQALLSELGTTAPISWVPVPSNIPVVKNAVATARCRLRCAGANGLLMGHFANYSDYSVRRLSQVVPILFRERSDLSLLLLGSNSREFRRHLLRANPRLGRRVHASGSLAPSELSSALAACDLMVQPYPDGVSTRRSSMAALLAHGSAIVTTNGIATEHLWNQGRAVITAPVDDADQLLDSIRQMIASNELRRAYGRGAFELYDERFALRHTMASLMEF